MMKTMRTMQRGFSLIELMIALLLGLILTSGIISVFLESRRNFTQDELISRVQENGNFALEMISRELKMNGFMGGVIDLSKITHPAGGGCLEWLLNPEPILEVFNNADGSEDTEFDCLTADAVADTDVFALKRVSDEPLVKLGAWGIGFGAFVPAQYYLRTQSGGLGASEIGTGITMTADIANIIGASSEEDVWEYYAQLFYIGLENGYPSLCMRSLGAANGGVQRCLVNGIEDFQIELGLDTDDNGTVDTYVSDNTVAIDPAGVPVEQIRAYRIYLLARSLEVDTSFPAASRTYTLGDHTYTTPVDRYYRRMFEATVERNNQVFTAF